MVVLPFRFFIGAMKPRRRRIYEGSDKDLFEGPEPGTLIQRFKDGPRHPASRRALEVSQRPVEGRGALNNRISEFLMRRLTEAGIPNHFIRRLNMHEQLVHALEPFPFSVQLHNYSSGDFAERFHLEEGARLPRVVMEYTYLDKDMKFPLVSEEHITAFGWASSDDMGDTVELATRINDFFSGFCLGVGLRLMQLDLVFGRFWDDDVQRVALLSELTPDSCRFWDLRTNSLLVPSAPVSSPVNGSEGAGGAANSPTADADVAEAHRLYQEVARRFGILPEGQAVSRRATAETEEDPRAPVRPWLEGLRPTKKR